MATTSEDHLTGQDGSSQEGSSFGLGTDTKLTLTIVNVYGVAEGHPTGRDIPKFKADVLWELDRTFDYLVSSLDSANVPTGESIASISRKLLEHLKETVPSGSYIALFASDIGGLIAKEALLSGATDASYQDVYSRICLLVLYGSPHRYEGMVGCVSILSKLAQSETSTNASSIFSPQALAGLAEFQQTVSGRFDEAEKPYQIISCFQQCSPESPHQQIIPESSAKTLAANELAIGLDRAHSQLFMQIGHREQEFWKIQLEDACTRKLKVYRTTIDSMDPWFQWESHPSRHTYRNLAESIVSRESVQSWHKSPTRRNTFLCLSLPPFAICPETLGHAMISALDKNISTNTLLPAICLYLNVAGTESSSSDVGALPKAYGSLCAQLLFQQPSLVSKLQRQAISEIGEARRLKLFAELGMQLQNQLTRMLSCQSSIARETYVVINIDSLSALGYNIIQALSAIDDLADSRVTVIVLRRPPCQDISSASGTVTDAAMPMLYSEDLTSADISVALDKDRADWLQFHCASFPSLLSEDAKAQALHVLKNAVSRSEEEFFLAYMEQMLEQANSPIGSLRFPRHSAASLLTAIRIHGTWLAVALIWTYNAIRPLTVEELDEAVSFDLTLGPMARPLRQTSVPPHQTRYMTAKGIMRVLPGAVKIENGRVYPLDESINQSLMDPEILKAVSASSPSGYLALSCLLRIRYELSENRHVGPSRVNGTDDGRPSTIAEHAFRSWVEYFQKSGGAETTRLLQGDNPSASDAGSFLETLSVEFLNSSTEVKKWLRLLQLPSARWATSEVEEFEVEPSILPISLRTRFNLTARQSAWLSSHLAAQSEPSIYYDHLLLRGLEDDDIQLCRAVCCSLKDDGYILRSNTVAQALLSASSQAKCLLDDTPRSIMSSLDCGMVLYGIASQNLDAIDSTIVNRPDHVRYLLRMASQLEDVSLLEKLLETGASSKPTFSWHTESLPPSAVPLIYAVASGRANVVELLSKKYDPRSDDMDQGSKALILASRLGFAKIVRILLDHNTADVNAKDPTSGNTALHLASRGGFTKTIGILLEYGAESLLENTNQELPVHLALANGHLTVAEWLLDIMPDSRGDIPLPLGENLPSIRLSDGSESDSVSSGLSFFDSDSDSDSGNPRVSSKRPGGSENKSPTGDTECNNERKEHQIPLNQVTAAGTTAFLLAAIQGAVALCEKLVTKGASVNICDREDMSALHYAAQINSEDLARFLLSEKSRFDVTAASVSYQTVTPLYIAASLGYGAMLQLLLGFTDHLSKLICWRGLPPLEIAIRRRHPQVVRILTEACLREENTHKALADALGSASGRGNVSMVECLLDHGVDVNTCDDYGNTALHFAACNDQVKTVELLLLRRAELNCQDRAGATPLMDAARTNSLASLKVLTNAGANLEAVDNDGYSALNLAIKHENDGCAKLLLSKISQRNPPSWNKLPNRLLRPLLRLAVLSSSDAVTKSIIYSVLGNRSEELGDASTKEFIRSLLWDEWKETLVFFWDHWDASGLVIGEYGTALHYAAMRHQPSVTKLLVTHTKHPVQVDSTEGAYGTALQAAIACRPPSMGETGRFLDTFQLLVKHHANLDSMAEEELSCALQAAAFSRRKELVETLLRKLEHTDRLRACGDNGTPLQALLSNPDIHDGHADDEVEELFQLLIEHGEDLMRESHEFCDGVTALHRAASYASVRIVGLVMKQKGVHLEKPDFVGRLPIHLALQFHRDRWDIIVTLDPQLSTLWEHDKMERSVLHMAATVGAIEVIEKILYIAKNSHLDVEKLLNEPDIDGWTPLHWACRPTRNEDAVGILVKNGADVNRKTHEGWLPRHVAIYHGRGGVLPILSRGHENNDMGDGDQDGTDTDENGLPSYAMRYMNCYCNVCFCNNFGEAWNCTTCLEKYTQDSYDLCFKCYRNREKFHPKDHVFDKMSKEWYESFQDRRRAALGVKDIDT